MTKKVALDFYKDFQLKESDLGFSGIPTLKTIFEMIGVSALKHCEPYDFGEGNLLKQGLTWMLAQVKFEFSPMKVNCKKFKLHTWLSGDKGIQTLREIEIFDEDNNSVVRATTAWIMVDYKLRRPARIIKSLRDIQSSLENPRKAVEDDYRKLQLDFDNKEITPIKIKPKAEEIDFNGHVTASVYFDWTISSLTRDFLESHNLIEAKSSFQNEILPNFEVLVEEYTEEKDGLAYSNHQIYYIDKKTNRKVINFLMQCKWFKN